MKTLKSLSSFEVDLLILIVSLLSACSVAPFKDSYEPNKSKRESLGNVTINFTDSYTNEKFSKSYSAENFKDAPSYYRYFKIPPSLKKCKFEIYHEVIHGKSYFYEDLMTSLSGSTLGIVPYSVDLFFKTKITLTGENNSITKETASDKIITRFGLVYIPMLFVGVFSDDYRLKGQVKSKMYAYQISNLVDELKDFKCQ